MNPSDEINWFRKNIKSYHIHGSNILKKLNDWKSNKLKDGQIKHLKVAVSEYKKWHKYNEKLKEYDQSTIKKRVKSLNEYKNIIEGIPFSAQSKFHSTVNEEFLYYLFKDLINDLKTENIKLGGIRAYSNLYFAPKNLKEFIKSPNIKINEKDQDFSIYREVLIKADGEKRLINIPVVSIECKTYIDKTMLEGLISTAEKIKMGNPYCLFLIMTETYDVSYDTDPAYSRIDQIYVLRKQKREKGWSNKTKKQIYDDVVLDLFNFVKNHLERDWSNIEKKLNEEGKII
jgi:hypothetical protein